MGPQNEPLTPRWVASRDVRGFSRPDSALFPYAGETRFSPSPCVAGVPCHLSFCRQTRAEIRSNVHASRFSGTPSLCQSPPQSTRCDQERPSSLRSSLSRPDCRTGKPIVIGVVHGGRSCPRLRARGRTQARIPGTPIQARHYTSCAGPHRGRTKSRAGERSARLHLRTGANARAADGKTATPEQLALVLRTTVASGPRSRYCPVRNRE